MSAKLKQFSQFFSHLLKDVRVRRGVVASLTVVVAIGGVMLVSSPSLISSDLAEDNADNILGANSSTIEGEPEYVPVPAEPVGGTIILKFDKGTSQAAKAAFISSIGGEVLEEIKGLNTMVVATTQKVKVKDAKILAKVEPDYYVSVTADETYTPNDEYFDQQWQFDAFDMSEIWNTEVEPKTIAVIDSGVCLTHPDLKANLVAGYDFIQNDNSPQDEFGHGCGVAGVIAAVANNEIGIAGMAQSAKVMPIRVLDANGIGTYSDVAAGIVWAADNGADLINLSLGGVNESNLLLDAVRYADSKGVTIVAAAGNTGSDVVLYPAKYSQVVAVGALTKPNANGDYLPASFSSTGGEIDAWAPGVDIMTTAIGGKYKLMSGTSLAAPVVSGMGTNFVKIVPIEMIVEEVGQADSGILGQASGQSLIPPVNVSMNRVEPGFGFGRNVDVWYNCDGANNGSPGAKKYHMGTDFISTNANGTEEVKSILDAHGPDSPEYIQAKESCWNESKGTPVFAVGDGEVVKKYANIFENYDKENAVIIKLDPVAGLGFQEVYAAYAHTNINGFGLKEGERVTKGQQIGKIGYNGNNPHLHFELRNYKSDPDAGHPFGSGYSTSASDSRYVDPCSYFYCPPSSATLSIAVQDNLGNLVPAEVSINSNGQIFGGSTSTGMFTGSVPVGTAYVVAHDGIRYGERSIEVYANASNYYEIILSAQCTSGPTVLGVNSLSVACGDPGPIPTGQCPGGENGDYCGGSVGGDPSTLYYCQNGNYTVKQVCGNGCLPQPQGTADHCAAGSVDYCQQVTWGGPGEYCQGDKLVTCSSTKVTTNIVQCAYGCQNNPLFTPDVCIADGSGGGTVLGSAKLYHDAQYSNFAFELNNVQKVSDEPAKDIRSVDIPDGWSFKVFDQDGTNGTDRCFNEDIHNLQDHEEWNIRIESIELFTEDVCSSGDDNRGPYWDVYIYDGDSKWWDRDISPSSARCHIEIDGDMLQHDFGDTNPCGGGTSPDNWVAEFIAKRDFAADDYIFDIVHDDGLQIFIDGKQKLIRSSKGESSVCPEYHLDGNTELKFFLREESGDTNIDVSWTDDLSACADVTPPVGTMELPDVNSYNNSTTPLLLQAQAHDPEAPQNESGIDKIDFYAKSDSWDTGEWTQVGSDNSDPYQYEWDTSSAPEGYYFFSANVFDDAGNESGILTDPNFWTYATIDRTPPSARVTPLPVSQDDFRFTVKWDGSDNLTPKAELNYDVQYQLNCTGAWTDWVGFRLGTSKDFLGIPGSNYCFRARAIDLAGNIGVWSVSTQPTQLPVCSENQFTAEYFDNQALTGEPIKIRCENEIDHNWGDQGLPFDVSEGKFGDGGDGPLTISGTVVDNPIDSTANGQVGTTTLQAKNGNFRVGHKIMVFQVQGANAGTYQFTDIVGYNSTTGVIITKNPLVTTYSTGGNNTAQVIVVKQYSDVTVTAGSLWKAKEWNGSTGGMLVFYANGETKVDGKIDATGAGFRGGTAGQNPNGGNNDNINGVQGESASGAEARAVNSNWNGGGGGPPRDRNGEGNGGGGGAYATAGQEGGKHISTSGIGGAGGQPIGDAAMNRIIFGGGGGGGGFGDAERHPLNAWGQGGDGGGFILINSNKVTVNSSVGEIRSNGLTGQSGERDQGAGGNGAGGGVLVRGKEVNIGSSRINAVGNNTQPGGTSGRGGASGHGRVRVEYYDSVSGNSAPGASIAVLSPGVDHFSARWTGEFNLAPAQYKFFTYADDGVKLWINDELVIDDWQNGYSEKVAIRHANADTSLKLEYYEDIGNAQVKLSIVPGSNNPPLVLPIPDQEASVSGEFEILNLGAYGFDPDYDYTYWESTQGVNISVSIDQFNQATITKTSGWVGEETITFTIFDEWGEKETVTALFRVIENLPPVITGLGDQVTDEDVAFTSFDLDDFGSDPDANDTITWTVSATQSIDVSINPENVFSAMPQPDWNGIEQITFTVTDSHGATAQTTVNLIVNPVNDAPEIVSQPITEIEETDLYAYQLTGEDVDGDPFTYTLVQGPADMELSMEGLVTWQTDFTDANDYTVELWVSDSDLVATQSYVLTVTDLNRPPEMSEISGQTVIEDEPFATFDLDDHGSDLDADNTLSYGFNGNGDLSVSIDSENIVTVKAPADWNGTQLITFTVTDNHGAEASTQAEFTATPVNDAPEITSSAVKTVLEDTQYKYNVNAIDVDGDDLVYSLIEKPAGMQINPDTGMITWTPGNSEVGNHAVKVQVSDGVLVDNQNYTLEVINVNDAPTAPTNPKPANGAVDQVLNLSFSWKASTDIDGDPIVYDVYLGTSAGSMTKVRSNISGTSFSQVLNPDQAYFWKVVAKDNHGAQTSSAVWSFHTVLPPFTVHDVEIVKETGGTKDGELNPGESITLDVIVDNNTAFNQPMIHAWLSTASPYVTIQDNFAQIITTPAGGTEVTKNGFKFKIAANTPVGTKIRFRVDLESKGGNPETAVGYFELVVK